MPFQPTDELSILLTVTEWNQIINALQEEKQRIANPLINKINLQAQQHEQQQQLAAQREAITATPAAAEPTAYANGELKGDIVRMPDAPRPPGWPGDTN